ncbi:hypothetical protein A3K29_05375 [Candidatus Collierbacteria bacterium RIFOXYB2_FULL_46_14]|nr:MAG: hypothetical protein A3K29_05375 [Candidatus Collierbacteria bacterium RIFOXYB2_FULL_46_14]OGD76566.1 MAG: hypothetical protein A3K43_05375 [Candidatus Collierbacteria bacterium RIFOXYA2_FULL_46_20]OGD77902.1 MAG: hypothetical protein A3K39_05375 [Candidatus Collierbacteria bacterium RIFOXYC2_FULL_43_15]OGD81192.1 MAG: hypothetical protein A2320_05870 [Pseudomonadales bacterium GWC2_63_15]OGD82624.1 MAG: hypothetical protein A3K36_05375 [Candidatus Collierbacteria bacterium RIFOXYD2_FUL
MEVRQPCTLTGGRLTKISVPQHAASLWRQVLQGPVSVPQWEINHRAGDVRTLLDMGLIVAKAEAYPQFTVELLDQRLRLNEQQIKTLIALSFCGMCREDFLAWARIERIDNPLTIIKSLTDLDVVEVTTRNGLMTFLLR